MHAIFCNRSPVVLASRTSKNLHFSPILNFTALCSALGRNAASASCHAPHPKASAALRAWICTHSLTHSIFISCLQSQYYVLTHSHSVSSSKWSLPFHVLPPMKTISWVAAFLEHESPWTEVKNLWAIRKVMVSTCTSCASFIILISQETLEWLLEPHLQYSRAFHYRVSNISRFFPQWVQRHRECIWVLPWQRPHLQCHFFKLVFLLMW